jgi:hypothetical protein
MLEALKKEELTQANTNRGGSIGNIHIAKRAQPISSTENTGGVSREKPLTPPSSESLSSTPTSLRKSATEPMHRRHANPYDPDQDPRLSGNADLGEGRRK